MHSGKVTGPTGELFAFYYHTAVLGQYDGTLWATGYNNYGQLGISTADQNPKTQSNIFQPILSDVKFAAGGYYRINVVKKDGSVWGAGYNQWGQIGDGTNVDKKEKFGKSNIDSGAVYVSAGYHHTAVLKDDGSLWATGHNTFGSVGDGTNAHKFSFVKVIDGGVADVAGGRYHTMALKTDGSLWATGYNNQGQLGDGTVTNRNKYVQVIDGLVMDVSAGGADFTIALMSDGSVMGVGLNSNGQLGDGTVTRRLKFVEVVDSGVKAVATGVQHTQLLKTDGSLWAAGYNNYGQLGDGTKTQRNKFVKVVDSGVKEVVTGQYFSVLLNDKHELCVTGYNLHGMLGTGDKTDVVGFDKKCYPRPVRATARTAAATANAHASTTRDPCHAAIAQLA